MSAPPGADGRQGERLRLAALIKRTVLFAGGELVNRGPDFFLLPLYAAVLTPDQFGIIALAATVTIVARTTLGLGLQTAAVKFFFDYQADDRRKFYGAMWFTSLAGTGLLYLVLDTVAVRWAPDVFRSVSYEPYLRLAVWTAWVGGAFIDIPREILKASGRAGRYTALSLFQVAMTTGFTVWLVIVEDRGAYGAILAHFLATAVVAGVCAIALVRWVRWPAQTWHVIVPTLAFSLPMIPHFLAQWALSLSDRVILERWVSLDEIGVYSVGYTIGWALSLAKVAGAHAMIPLFGGHRHAEGASKHELSATVTHYFAALAVLGAVVALFAPEVVALLADDEYARAAQIVPWIALAALVFGLYNPSVQILHFVLSDSRSVAFATVTGGTVSITLNLLLVPRWGIAAAVTTTVITYSLVTLLILWRQQRRYPMPWEFARVGTILAVTIALTAAGVALGWGTGLPGTVFRLAILAGCARVLLYVSRRPRPASEDRSDGREFESITNPASVASDPASGRVR